MKKEIVGAQMESNFRLSHYHENRPKESHNQKEKDVKVKRSELINQILNPFLYLLTMEMIKMIKFVYTITQDVNIHDSESTIKAVSNSDGKYTTDGEEKALIIKINF